MSAYLGTLGRLVPIYSNPSMGVSREDGYTFETTLEGRVKAQARPVSRRSWTLSAKAASPTDVGTLGGFASGEWGPGPFIWVAPDAPSINLLTPEVSRCGPAALFSLTTRAAGPMNLGGGEWAGRSLTVTDLAARSYVGGANTPVIPGEPVTASMWVVGAGAKLRLHFYAADGSTAGYADSSGSGNAGVPIRLAASAVAPANAVACTLSTVGAGQAARPAITWTDVAFPWGEGWGCLKAVVSAFGRTALAASRNNPGLNYSDVSFTITEVG